MDQPSGRDKEAIIIRQANRAAAVGRLMLGDVGHWDEFLGADRIDLTTLPRRQLKSGKADIKRRLSAELEKFCEKNFRGMTQQKLSDMYEDIKGFRGMEMPLSEFEHRFATVHRAVLKGNPAHLTVSVSLWGLQFKIPEEELAHDIMEASGIGANAQEQLKRFERNAHDELLRNRGAIGALIRQKLFAARSTVIACFNLMEAYLNGIAWDYLRTTDTNLLSNRSKKLLEDSTSATTREKLQKYPEIIAGISPWSKDDADTTQFLEIVKPFRDSLVHPSPFAAPEKFGGYDKLRLLYRIDKDTADLAASITAKLVVRIHNHIKPNVALPPWLEEMCAKLGIETMPTRQGGTV
jgi:hypothetical protein